ncbi:MAG: hypothetical protein ACMUIG_10330 [Thermoplasmatota archaeon]
MEGLLAVTEDTTDSDGDGLPDSIERIIGTDPYKLDSDHDDLNDSFEVSMNTDPLKPDSNEDGLSDAQEILDVPADPDGDGVPNAWDRDNDNDGIEDASDHSPFSKTGLLDTLRLDLNSTGKPLYISLQIRPKNPSNMRLLFDTMDWPLDDKGIMKDLDNSTEDVLVTPVLEISSNIYPDQDEVVEYGMKVGNDSVILPLNPVWEYGRIVGLAGRIYFPPSIGAADLDLEMGLKWVVTGITDAEVRTLKTSNGKYLTSMDPGSVKANSTEITEAQRFTWEKIDNDRIAMRTMEGYFVGIDQDGVLRSGFPKMENACIFTLVEVGDSHYLKTWDGRFVKEQGDGSFKAEDAGPAGSLLTIQEGDVRTSSTTLITYHEKFTVGSLVVTENHGTDIGLFYSEDTNEMMAANMLFSAGFMRNYSLNIDEMQYLLAENEIFPESIIEGYSHLDLAVRECMTRMTKEALQSLPENGKYSMTVLMEDSSASMDLVDLSVKDGSTFHGNLSEIPVITTRMMRSNWYETPNLQPIDASSFVQEIMPFLEDLDDENATMMLGMFLFWNIGEIRVVREGGNILDDLSSHWASTVAGIMGMITAPTLLIITFVRDFIVPALEFIHYSIKMFYTSSEFLVEVIKGTWNGVKFLFKTFETGKVWGSAISNLLTGFGIIVDVIAYGIDLTILIFNLVAMYSAVGGDPFGITITTIYGVLAFSWITALFGVGLFITILTIILGLQSIPVAGQVAGVIIGIIAAIVGLLYALEELIVSWITGKSGSEWIITWIIELIAGVRTLTSLDMEMVGSEIIIHDKTENGLDAGDRIEYTSVWDSIVTRETHGSADHLRDSYIEPQYHITSPVVGDDGKRKHTTGSFTNEIYSSNDGDKKETRYESGAWIVPGIAKVNYEFALNLRMKYNMYYQEHLFWGLIPFEPKSDSGSDHLSTKTLYYDVLPETIDEFGTWTYLKHSDYDGDNLNNSDEVDTSPWNWDSDGDGLGDGYELDIGYDPTDHDMDRDGIWDRREMLSGTDPDNEDSDGDGLSDFEELEGWIINFTYYGHPFEWHIVSDPKSPDTDGDGLNDTIEYLCLLNPISSDTDGNGIIDEIVDYSTSEMDHVDTIGDDEPFGIPDCVDMVCDKDGNMYVISGFNDSVIKLGPDGEFLWEYHDESLNNMRSLAIGPDGKIYVGRYHAWGYPDPKTIFILEANGTLNGTWHDPDRTDFGDAMAMAVDDAGHIYSFGYADSICPFMVKFSQNGTVLRSREYFTGDQPGQFVVGSDNSIDVDSRGRIYVLDPGNHRIQVFDQEFNLSWVWDISEFGTATDIWIDSEDSLYISWDGGDLDGVQKYDKYRRLRIEWPVNVGEKSVCSGDDHDIYVSGNTDSGATIGRIVRYRENITIHKVEKNYTYNDTDGDGLFDVVEEEGWEINVTLPSGVDKRHVVSSSNLSDTDLDGLSDKEEHDLGTDPASLDTDMDTVPDPEEVVAGTDPASYDSDLDGLDDGVELIFGSDPLLNDTDGEGLLDNIEFDIGTDPNDNDTDDDGLSDHEEWTMGLDPRSPDGDGDMMFDGEEVDVGTNPLDSDHDKDGIDDGYEKIYNTSAVLGDSDGDQLKDGFEVSMFLNPINNDTDEDGMMDSRELEIGYNPRSGDSDGDGIGDLFDMDFDIDISEEIVVAMDEGNRNKWLMENLSGSVDVLEVSPGELLTDHTNKSLIVIVGMPSSENGTAGRIIRDLLGDNADLIAGMNTASGRCVVRYGVWKSEQTVVLLSEPRPFDHNRILSIFRNVRMTIEEGRIVADYLSPRSFVQVDYYEVVRETQTSVLFMLNENESADVTISGSSSIDGAEPLAFGSGLGPDEVALKRYTVISVEDDQGNTIGEGNIDRVEFMIYYRSEDLDMNDDGDADDPQDLNESTLGLYYYGRGKWNKMSEGGEIVIDTGVNTTDQIVHGMEYEGYVWAVTTRPSAFAISGMRNEIGFFTLEIGPVIDENGDPVEGADVKLDFGGFDYQNHTDASGNVSFDLSNELKGTNVTITFSAEGHWRIIWTTRIDEEGKLTGTLPILRNEGIDDTPKDEWNPYPLLISFLIVILVFIGIGILLFVRWKKSEGEGLEE